MSDVTPETTATDGDALTIELSTLSTRSAGSSPSLTFQNNYLSFQGGCAQYTSSSTAFSFLESGTLAELSESYQ